MRAGMLRPDDFPATISERLGPPGSAWVGAMIDAVIEGSLASGEIRMDEASLSVMNELRHFMFQNVYLAPMQREHHRQAVDVIRRLMDHHLGHPDDLPSTYRDNDADRVVQAADYVAGMTDRFALRTHERLFGSPGIDDPQL
jgi:dGTPase